MISENVPEITDELKGIRNADLSVGETLADQLSFGEDLVIKLRAGDVQTVNLKLYTAGSSVNVKIDGKAVSFTPAGSDDPYYIMSTFELENAAGRTFEIVLSTNDAVSFKLTAEAKQTEVQDLAPETEEEPAEGNTNEPAPVEDNNAEEDKPEPTIQASVKTYNALKVGSSLSDTLVGGQKAKLQVKCGKNVNVVLTLKADPDDLSMKIDGSDAQFTQVAEGTYEVKLENVAFRKFSIVLTAKRALGFTLQADAGEVAEVTDEEETENPDNEDINIEETETSENDQNDEMTEDATEEATESSEDNTEDNTEDQGEPSEETDADDESDVSELEPEGNEEEVVENEAANKEEIIITESFPEIQVIWGENANMFGSTVQLKADLKEFEGQTYTTQWQISADNENWSDIENETGVQMELVITPENYKNHWRLAVRIEEKILVPVEESPEIEADQPAEEPEIAGESAEDPAENT